MEPRTEWTDARLNDLVERFEKSLEDLDQGRRELGAEIGVSQRAPERILGTS
jgi:hypothetical protein